MADLPISRNWLVQPDNQVQRKWLEVQIQERKSRINKLRQDIEDLQKGKIVEIEATVLMLEKELTELVSRLEAVEA